MTSAQGLPGIPNPLCGSLVHEFGPMGPAPFADYWADWHGCSDNFACRQCLQTVQNAFETKPPGNTLTCAQCGKQFHTFDDYVKWRQL